MKICYTRSLQDTSELERMITIICKKNEFDRSYSQFTISSLSLLRVFTTKKYVKSGGFNMAVINNRHKFQYNTSFH